MNQKTTSLKDRDTDREANLPASVDLTKLEKAPRQQRKYRARAAALARGRLINLAPDVAAVFTSSEAVNEALRALIRIMETTANAKKLAA